MAELLDEGQDSSTDPVWFQWRTSDAPMTWRAYRGDTLTLDELGARIAAFVWPSAA